MRCRRLLLPVLCVLANSQVAPGAPPSSRPSLPAGTTVNAKVVGVTDGDTITVLHENRQYRIRLAGLDAPETGQPFGTRAKEALSAQVFGREVKIVSEGVDRYGRTLAMVYAPEWINAEMVKEGLAWHYTRFSNSKGLAAAEKEARAAKRGLWADPNPIAPWDWRTRERELKSRPEIKEGHSKPTAEKATGYWITNSSSVRHNSTCRYYQKSSGRECGPTEGRACKICGG